MTRHFRHVISAVFVALGLSALGGTGCGPSREAELAGPGKLIEAQKARGASLQGEAGGLAKSSRRR